LWLTLSGGLDSEVLVRSFLDANIPFHVASLRFADGKNSHDLFWAERFIRKYKIENWRLFDIDIPRFFESGLANDYAVATDCTAPELLATMWLMDQVEGIPVLGSGECFFWRDDSDGYVPGVSPYYSSVPWFLVEKESVASWYRYAVWRKKACVPGFFQYTPEQLTSFVLEPLTFKLITNQIYGKRDSKSVKHDTYAHLYPDLEPRPKYTGYENLKGLVFDFQSYLIQLLGPCNQRHLTHVNYFLPREETREHSTPA